jgi:hypothetical protein
MEFPRDRLLLQGGGGVGGQDGENDDDDGDGKQGLTFAIPYPLILTTPILHLPDSGHL